MGATGFTIPAQGVIDEEDLELLWGELCDELHGWLEQMLTETEHDLLEVVNELLEFVCELEEGALPFWFHDYDTVGEAAGYHWYVRALEARREAVLGIGERHGLTLDLSRLELDDGALLLFHGGEVYLLDPEHLDEVCAGDGAIPVTELDDDLQIQIREVQSTRRCGCSLCGVGAG